MSPEVDIYIYKFSISSPEVDVILPPEAGIQFLILSPEVDMFYKISLLPEVSNELKSSPVVGEIFCTNYVQYHP